MVVVCRSYLLVYEKHVDIHELAVFLNIPCLPETEYTEVFEQWPAFK